jgi:hypothetical protein
MTIQAQFVPRNYDVFAGLDVDKKSMAVIFTDHQQLMQSLRLSYSAAPRPLTERTAIAGRFVLETEDPGLRDRPREGRIHESVPIIESGHA